MGRPERFGSHTHPARPPLRIADVETTNDLGPTPAIYPIQITHLRRSPVQHFAEHRSYSWYVDIDRLPQLPGWMRPFTRFDAADHLDGDPSDSLRQRVEAFLARHGVFIPGGRVTALLMPRVLGRAFSPLSLFWCHDSAGVPRCVIAEIQNGHGERSAFLLPAVEEGTGAATAAAPSQASRITATPVTTAAVAARSIPVLGEDGYFLVRVPRPGDTLDLTVSLHRDNHTAMVTTWRGRRRRASVGQVLLMQLTHPLAPQVARLTVRFHALVLRWRGMPTIGRRSQSAPNSATRHASAGWGVKRRSWATS